MTLQGYLSAPAYRSLQIERMRRRAREKPALRTHPYTFHGGNAKFLRLRAAEKILSGPADTGKTLACLYLLNDLAWSYSGLQAALVRKTYKSMHGTVLESLERKVLPVPPGDRRSQVHAYGGRKPERYLYPNGATIWVGGMDDPSRVLSAERDVIYVNQAEELSLDDWETLSTRASGRAGNMPGAFLMGDCNPGPAHHWIRARAEEGKLALVESRHRDNPAIFDPSTGELTAEGKARLAPLERLSGARRKRLLQGLWASVEGAVYEAWDPAVHLLDPFEIPESWVRFRAIDFGYTNPFVCQWWALDEDRRMYLYREVYMSGRLVEDHAGEINRLSQGEQYAVTVADHDAEDRATLERYGIPTDAARKAVRSGIEAVQARLRAQEDGRPRLYVLRDALVARDARLAELRKPTHTAAEFEGYVWPQAADGRPLKELPVQVDDHGLDALRYAVMWADSGMEGRLFY